MLDYDGTLTPIVARPIDAWLAAGVREDLRALTDSGRVTVAVVSGRSLADVRGRVGLPGVIYAGCHGLEIDGPHLSYVHPEAAASSEILRGVAGELAQLSSHVPGLMIESKRLSIAVHYRNAPPHVGGRVTALVRRIITARRGLTMLRGRKVLEILPVDNHGKGPGALRIQAEMRAARSRTTTLYIGDDATDELAFRALRHRAITVKVGGGGTTCAALRVRCVDDVHRILSALAALVRKGDAR